MARTLDTVVLEDRVLLVCPQCRRIGSPDDEGNIVATTNIAPCADSTRPVRCVGCGWRATVHIYPNLRCRTV
jgi:hypothetical protein